MREYLDKCFICFTEPKSKHKAKNKIEERGYFCYLPMLITENVYGDKKRRASI